MSDLCKSAERTFSYKLSHIKLEFSAMVFTEPVRDDIKMKKSKEKKRLKRMATPIRCRFVSRTSIYLKRFKDYLKMDRQQASHKGKEPELIIISSSDEEDDPMTPSISSEDVNDEELADADDNSDQDLADADDNSDNDDEVFLPAEKKSADQGRLAPEGGRRELGMPVRVRQALILNYHGAPDIIQPFRFDPVAYKFEFEEPLYLGPLQAQREPENNPVQPRPAQCEPEDNTVQQLPAQHEPGDNIVQQLPAQCEPGDNTVQQLPAERETGDNTVQQLPAERETGDNTVQQLPAQREPEDLPEDLPEPLPIEPVVQEPVAPVTEQNGLME